MGHILQLKNISKYFDDYLVLNNVNLTFEAGKIHAILGENGAGKSTLVKILSGDLKADGGEVYFDNEKTAFQSAFKANELGISTMYQEVNLALKMSVAENMFMGRLPYKKIGGIKIIDWKKVKTVCNDLLEHFGCRLDWKTPVERLGMGERRFVEIMKAFCSNSKVLVFDEATEWLTENETKLVFELIKKAKQKGVAVIFISHHVKEIVDIADTISILSEGTIVDTFENKQGIYDHIFKYLDHKFVMNRYPKIKVSIGKTLLSTERIYAEKYISGVTMHVKEGEVVGIYGLAGSGRTAIAEALVGLNPILEGTISLRGKKTKISSPREALKNRIYFLCEDRTKGLIEELPLAPNISLSNFKGVTTYNIIDKALEKRIASTYQEKLGIKSAHLKEPVKHLSGGNKQKVMMAKCLFTHPDIVILDEPTAGLDTVSKIEIYNLMNELILRGVGILLISSDLHEVQGMCDRVYVISKGEVLKELNRSDLSERALLTPYVDEA